MKEDIPRYIISQLGLTRDPLEGRTSLFLTSLPSLGLIVGFNKPIIKLSNKPTETLNGIVYHSVKQVFFFFSESLHSIWTLTVACLPLLVYHKGIRQQEMTYMPPKQRHRL